MAGDDSVTQWIDQLKNGDHLAAEPLFRRYYKRMVHVARARLAGLPGAAVDEEDVAVSAFERFRLQAAGGGLDKLKDRDDLWPLLVKIVCNKATDKIRFETRGIRGGGRVLDEGAWAGGESYPTEIGIGQAASQAATPDLQAMLKEELQRRLDGLPDERCRRVAVLRLEGWRVVEIAQEARLSEARRGTVAEPDSQVLVVTVAKALMTFMSSRSVNPNDLTDPQPSQGFVEERLHPVCEAFEALCRARPVIEDFLHGWHDDERRALLTELLHLELYYYPSEKRPSLTEYRDRFPDDRDLVEDVFRHYFPQLIDSSAPPPADYLTVSDRTTADTVASRAESATTRFRVLRAHAQGGLGLVLIAHDEQLSRRVAFKQIQPRLADDPQSQAQFVREAEITGGLEHPGIIPVYSLGYDSAGRPFYAMRLVEGESLKDAIARFHTRRDHPRRESTLRALLRRFVDVCNAVEYAHSRGIIHRDLKPGNIMLGEFGETLVVDWGLARRLSVRSTEEERAGSTSAHEGEWDSIERGARVGTPQYMSPEQAAGELDRVGPCSDVYSLGATLCHLLTGQAPRVNECAGALRDAARPLEAICLKAMARLPEDRYPSVKAIAQDVERWLADEPVSCWRESLPARIGRWVKHHRVLMSGSAAAMLVGICSLTVVLAILSAKNRTLHRANELQRLAKEESEAKRILADEARRRSDQVLNYLVKAFGSPADHTEREKLTVTEALDEAVEHLHADFRDEPLIQIRLLATIGRTFQNLTLNQKAIHVWHQAVGSVNRPWACSTSRHSPQSINWHEPINSPDVSTRLSLCTSEPWHRQRRRWARITRCRWR